jgi:hypothetical protein
MGVDISVLLATVASSSSTHRPTPADQASPLRIQEDWQPQHHSTAEHPPQGPGYLVHADTNRHLLYRLPERVPPLLGHTHARTTAVAMAMARSWGSVPSSAQEPVLIHRSKAWPPSSPAAPSPAVLTPDLQQHQGLLTGDMRPLDIPAIVADTAWQQAPLA